MECNSLEVKISDAIKVSLVLFKLHCYNFRTLNLTFKKTKRTNKIYTKGKENRIKMSLKTNQLNTTSDRGPKKKIRHAENKYKYVRSPS